MEVSFEATQRQEASHTSDNIDCCFPDKLNSNQSYERSSNGRERLEQELKSSQQTSKLPRVVKTNPICYGNQYFKPTENRINDSGCDGEKFKPSQIPRRQSNIKEAPIRPCVMPKKFMAKPPFKTQAKNVQRIQVLNTLQDFYTEKRPITTSIATSRPIPTLGQIYRRTEDTNRVTDWLLERDNSYLHAPISSLAAEQDHISEVSTAGDATHIDGNPDVIITKNSSEKPVPEHREPPQIANNWMSIHEYPTRDNESGYCSMSLAPQVPRYMNSKHANVIPIVKQSEKKHYLAISERKSSSPSISSNDGNSAGMLLSEQLTVVLADKPQGSNETILAAKIVPRVKTSMVSQNSRSAFTKGMQFPSDGTFAKSYVDCPSEVFQKTTDFETAGYASSSSIAATDLEYREYSSRGTLENIDGNSMVGEDTHQWSSTGTKSLNSFCCDLAEDQIALMQQTDELSTKCNAGLMSKGTFRHYSNCCMVRRDRCKRLHGRSVFRKHSSYKDKMMSSSSNKFKERRPSDLPRKRLSFRRMCQRRWNAVCQKTVERFGNRPKSSIKIMKIRMMYAHPELFLEDVNVQTMDATCTDAGMGTINRENRSAGIATSLKWVSPNNHFMDAATSGTIPVQKKPVPRYGDFGPSMFPWKFSSCSTRKFITPQNSNILSNVPKKRRQSSRSIISHKPNECISTRSKSVQSVNKLLKDESSLAIVIKDSTPSVSKEIQAELSGPLRQVESKTTIIISRPVNVKHMRKDQATESDENESKKSMFNSINDSGVVKADTDQKRSFEEAVYETAENTQIETREPSYQNVILTGAGTADFLHGKNEELLKSLQYSDLIYLEQPYTNNMIACNPAEVDLSFCAPSKRCQTGTSCRMHYLCDRSTSIETQSPIRLAVNKMSQGMVTVANSPQKVSIGLSGYKLNRLEKKEACTETVSPLAHLVYQGPKIISISSGFMTSPSVDTIKRETRSAGNSAKTIMLKDIQILTSPLLRCRTSRLVSCGTDTIYDIEGHSKATSVEKIVLYSDTGTDAIEIKPKKSFDIEGSRSLEIPNFSAKHYVPASINTDTSKSTSLGVSNDTSSKLSSLAVSKKSSRPVTLIDVCVQHTNPKDKPIKAYRSAAIVCSKMPSVCKTEIGTSTVELNIGQDQEIDTSEELTPSIGDYDPGTPKSGASSKLNANKWIKKCIASMEKDQITTILRQRSKSKSRTEKKGTKKASQFTLNSSEKVSSSDISPFSGNGKKSDIPVAAMTCITCLKPQTSTPLLSTDVSEELMSKLITQERTRSLLLKPTPFSGVFKASDILRKKELKGTPAQTALSGVQNAEIQLCGEKKSKNVFTSRYQLASPAPCQGGWLLPHSPDCKFMYERPRCLVHKSWTDATVQMRPSQQDIVLAAMSAQTQRHSVAVATESAPGHTPHTTKPSLLPQLLEITDKCPKKSLHSAAVSVEAHLTPTLQTREQNTGVTEVVLPQAATAKMSSPRDVTFSQVSVPTRLTREQNTEFAKEVKSPVLLEAATGKMSHHAVAVSTDPEPTLLTREQNTEKTEGFLARVLETARKKFIPRTVDASTAYPAPGPPRVAREQNTDFTEEFLSQVLVAKKPAPHNVTFSTAESQQARLTREQNTDYTEEFLSKVLAATNTKNSVPHAAVLSAKYPISSLQTQGQNTELAEEFLSQVPTVTNAKKSHQAIAMPDGMGSALHRVTRSANTKLMGDVYDYIPPNCIELLVCDSLAEDATQTFPGNCPPIIWFSRNQPVHFHDCNLMSSCRYYSKLLTEQITRVKENLAKHLTPSDEDLVNQGTAIDTETQAEPQRFKEACTMKPSGRHEFACQTQVRRVPNIRQIRAMSCCTLNHAFSVTDICRGHENDLKTVYFLLSAIEGRIRRMKRHL